MALRDVFLCLLVAILWGFNYVTVKLSVTELAPMTAMSIRYCLVALCLLPYLIKMPRHLYWPVFRVGMFLGFFYFALFFWAAERVSASLAAVILQLQVPFGMIFSIFLLKEPPSFLGIVGTFLAFVGVIFAIGKVEWSGDLVAIILLFVAASSWGYGSVLVRHLKVEVDPLTLNAGIALFSLPFLIVLALMMEPHPLARIAEAHLTTWASMAYMVLISTIFCYASWFKLIKRYSISLIIPSMLLVPVFAILSSKFFLQEPLQLHLIVGAAVTIIGVGLVVVKPSLLRRIWQ